MDQCRKGDNLSWHLNIPLKDADEVKKVTFTSLIWKERRCFENRTWRLQAESIVWCCRLVIWAWSPSVTECLLLFCLSSSRTNHSGCAFLSSLTPTRLGPEKSSVTLPGPEMFLILPPEPPSSERMLEDFYRLFCLNACNVLIVKYQTCTKYFWQILYICVIWFMISWNDYFCMTIWVTSSQSWCCNICWRLNQTNMFFYIWRTRSVDLCSSTRALNYIAVHI